MAAPPASDQDWATYNYDVSGSRFNRGETALDRTNVARLEEKWRFPPPGAKFEIGAVHATPIVVNGDVYFGTATDPAFYKLRPDGTLCWQYRNPRYGDTQPAAPRDEGERHARFQSAANGVMCSALVTGDTVYFGDRGGWFYALDRATGKERWKLSARAKSFPGRHRLNVFFASPILADGKLIVAGGTLEQVVSALPLYRGNNGRGFVMALDPADGAVLWKYDVGPKPAPLDPPITLHDAWGDHTFYYGPATSSVWSTPSFDERSGTIFFGTDVNTAPRRPTEDDPRSDTRESCAVIAVDVHDGREKWLTQINPGDVWTNGMRSYDPATGRYKDQSIGDTPKVYQLDLEGRPTTVVGVGCKNGGFYVLRADDGRIIAQTPLYTGPPSYPLSPPPDPRMLALPSCIGGLQTGCATDGHTIFTNGIDALLLGSQETRAASLSPPTAGRVVA
ncbi:MAG TPA: PQQ-binding-like beta-propeller repeat protein, partial [Pirellulales bacterium]